MKIFQVDRIVAKVGIAAILLLTGGCGADPDARPQVEISGAVTLDGTALGQGSIQFRSDKTGESAYANLSSDGHYSLVFPAADIGTEYSVTVGPPVIEDQNPLEMMKNPGPETKNTIPQKYSTLQSSGLKVKIEQAGENEFNFDLKKNDDRIDLSNGLL